MKSDLVRLGVRGRAHLKPISFQQTDDMSHLHSPISYTPTATKSAKAINFGLFFFEIKAFGEFGEKVYNRKRVTNETLRIRGIDWTCYL